jgi:peptidoglycan/LPS O-acetylase OafA/YrhL
VTRTISRDEVARSQLSETFPVLDTMRAVGALAVVATHSGFNAAAYTDWGAGGRLVARMDVGVAIFFVLSGFLLSRPWLARARAELRPPAVGRYFWKRFLRIFPAYVVVAVIALSLIDDNADLGPVDWLKTLTMTNIYFSEPLPYGLTQTWSLATEVAFYLVLPLLMLLAVGRGRLRSRRVLVVLAGMVALNVAWLLDLSGRVPGNNPHVNEWLPAYLTWFGVGIGLAMVQLTPEQPGRVRRAVRELAASPGSCWTVAFGLLLVAGTSVAGPTLLVPASAEEALTKNLLYAAIAALVILPGIFAAPGGRYTRVMSHPALRHLGHISYGVFLIHMSVLQFVMWWTGYPLFGGHLFQIFALTLVLSLAAAEVLYRVVELPCMRLRNLGSRSTPAATTAETATSTR